MKKLICISAMTVALVASAGAQATPVVGQPLPIDTPVASATGGAQSSAAVAFDGTNYLVIWNDTRDLGPGALYGARVDKTGKVLDPTGFRIMDSAGLASVVFGGGQFLVAWMNNTSVAYARLDASGKPLDAAPIQLTQTATGVASPGVAWNGTEFLVVWEDWRANQSDVYGARVSKAGALLDTSSIGIATSTSAQRAPKVASDGTGFFVTWMDEGVTASVPRAFGARVGADGSVLDAQGSALSPSDHEQFYPVVCFDGSNYQVAWEDINLSDASKDGMRGALVSPAGTTVAAELVLSATSTDSSLATACRVGGSLVAWRGGSTRVDTTGHVLDPTGLLVPPQTTFGIEPAAGSDGTDYLLVWQDPSNARFLVSTIVSASGLVASPSGNKLIKSANTQTTPAIVRGAGGYLAVFGDDRASGGAGLYAMPLDNTGVANGAATLIDSQISLSAGTGKLALAWNGSHYLVVWQGGSRIFRLDATGKPLGSLNAPIRTNTQGSGTASGALGIASDGSHFLLAWEDFRNTPPATTTPFTTPNSDIYAARFADDGTLLDAQGFQVAGGTGNQSAPAAAFDGTNFLVTWVEDYAVHGARVDKSGALVDTTSVLVGSGASPYAASTVAWGQNSYLVAWVGTAGPMGRRLDASGKVLDAAVFPIPVDSTLLNLRSLATAWDGQSFLVAWAGSDSNGGIAMGARVNADGARPDSDGFAIEPLMPGESSEQSSYPSQVGLASDGNGHWVALADRFDPSPGVEVVRVHARLITDCVGSQCPAPPDGGVLPRADASVTDTRISDAGRADVVAADSASDAGVIATADATPEAGPRDVAKDRSDDAEIADAGMPRDGEIVSADGGRDAVSSGDTAGPNTTGSTKAKSSGCNCSVGTTTQAPSGLWSLLPFAAALGIFRRKRRATESRRNAMTKTMSVLGMGGLFVSTMVAGAALPGCGSSRSGSSSGTGGKAGTGGTIQGTGGAAGSGGTTASDGAAGAGAGGIGSGGVGTGGAGGKATGGSGAGGSPGSGGSATGGNGGSGGVGGGTSTNDGGTIIVPCPTDIPSAGSACDGNTGQCSWGTSARLDCRTTGVCSHGVWSVDGPRDYCSAPAPAACPTTATIGTCSDTSLVCYYPSSSGALCSCVPCTCNPGPPGPPCAQCNGQPMGTPVWFCNAAPTTTSPCPSTIPNQGSACDTANMACPSSACNQTIAVCTAGVWTWTYSTMCPVCASPDTPIATPSGNRPIADLTVGDLVYSVEDDGIVLVPILRVGRTPVTNHRVARIRTADGRVLEISPGHPTADGRSFSDLRAGTRLDGVLVESMEMVPYVHAHTHDILPASKSGTYFAAGMLIGSTLTMTEGDIR